MKNILISLCAVLFCICSGAQEVKYRYLISPYQIDLMTTAYNGPIKNLKLIYPKIMFALQYIQTEEQGEEYYLHVYCPHQKKENPIPPHGKLLIRTNDNHIISLKDCGSKSFVEYRVEFTILPHRTFRSNGYSCPTHRRKEYEAHGKYKISHDDLCKLITAGISSIRVETTADYIKHRYSAKRAQKSLKKLYDILQDNINPYVDLLD